MPSTIPYDPSLVLGNLVRQEALDNLEAISQLQGPIDAAEDLMNDYIAMKRSIDMTIQELVNMGIDARELAKESEAVGKSIQESAVDFARIKLDNLAKIQPIKAKMRLVHDSIESPIDYVKSTTKKDLPLSSDSVKINVQYFSFDENQQSSSTQASAVKSFVSSELFAIFGGETRTSATASVQSQMNSQYENHDISGTLVISITCTHKNALLLSPLVIDIDKAIRVWNRVHKDDMINPNDQAGMATAMANANTENEKSLTILSGLTHGSCFIGMVHILNSSTTTSSETMNSIASSLQQQSKAWQGLTYEMGGFGVDASFASSARNLLSTQTVTSHCSLVAMGAIPSLAASSLAMGVKEFARFDGKGAMDSLVALQTATSADQETVSTAANKAMMGQQVETMKTNQITSVLSSLADITKAQNLVLDTNSMMNAMTDYMTKIADGELGVPINFYLKPITKSQLVEMWISKYYPGRLITMAGDDSNTNTAANTATNTGSTTTP